ncbi:S-methyl-5'-thioadenosine phosphorylase-like [Ischnura elegans]|uniref:S-methyl-5'-thioadenosine phosphorylase-like n=1 Tax=Ischnura elegans TaxID=197161 RepID=UPI001ED8BCA3|nr:S-methyl-5'-thioadenosine phosphorylase-like [Ischnura elegans]
MSPIKIGIIGGSGFANPDLFTEEGSKEVKTPFGNPSAPYRIGKVNGIECVLLARHGANHTIPPTYVNYRANIWGFKELGCTHIIATTACGSLQEDVHPGDIIMFNTFIDRTNLRTSTFFDGTVTDKTKGVCHIPMEPALCDKLAEVIYNTACERNVKAHPKGTVVCIEGPRFSSIAESKLYRSWGAHAVNMTAVPELCLAKELGLLYCSVGVVTDYDCWHEVIVNAQDVLKCFKKNIEKVSSVLHTAIPKIASMSWDDDIESLKKVVASSMVN